MELTSTDPATGEIVWRGEQSHDARCADAVARARAALAGWAGRPNSERIAIVEAYADRLRANAGTLTELISRETGKPRWESEGEVAAMVGKIAVSISAQTERAGSRQSDTPFGHSVLRHRPHGVMAVLGPFNFPGHLPNGHIVPALLAGNCVVFKPSELTPAVGEAMARFWTEAELPDGVLNLVQGGRETGEALTRQDIDGLLFTGSAATGRHFRRQFAERPDVILALELGGNNPLIAWDGDPEAIASIVVLSAFITSGQRCSCARRLIVRDDAHGRAVIDATIALTGRLRIGRWDDDEQPFMGPVISQQAATQARQATGKLVTAGGWVLMAMQSPDISPAFVTPAIVDMTDGDDSDEEVFAPLLKLRRAGNFAAAQTEANRTRFGLSAGLVSDDAALWQQFLAESRAGIVNWNRPTTGAASNMPFGGLGESGNHRPSAYYAADYCAYPVGSFEATKVSDQSTAIIGLK